MDVRLIPSLIYLEDWPGLFHYEENELLQYFQLVVAIQSRYSTILGDYLLPSDTE